MRKPHTLSRTMGTRTTGVLLKFTNSFNTEKCSDRKNRIFPLSYFGPVGTANSVIPCMLSVRRSAIVLAGNEQSSIETKRRIDHLRHAATEEAQSILVKEMTTRFFGRSDDLTKRVERMITHCNLLCASFSRKLAPP